MAETADNYQTTTLSAEERLAALIELLLEALLESEDADES